jgi:hypothetical protein
VASARTAGRPEISGAPPDSYLGLMPTPRYFLCRSVKGDHASSYPFIFYTATLTDRATADRLDWGDGS